MFDWFHFSGFAELTLSFNPPPSGLKIGRRCLAKCNYKIEPALPGRLEKKLFFVFHSFVFS